MPCFRLFVLDPSAPTHKCPPRLDLSLLTPLTYSATLPELAFPRNLSTFSLYWLLTHSFTFRFHPPNNAGGYGAEERAI
ncbi:hypothetical protein DL93DRAFT_2089754, partial [Clavulina sp. PMI_390]